MLKRHGFKIFGIFIIVILLLIFTVIRVNEGSYFQELAVNQAVNDVELTALDLNSQITNISTEQRVVSQMMANDIFLKEWCEDETSDAGTEHAQFLYSYLKAYQEKYDYDVVFFVSNNTYNYYYNDGLNKVISPDDDFDAWYFNFLDLNQEYDIQIDHDEVNDYSVSLFVNCIVEDNEGNTLGVVGAGQEIDDFESSVEYLMNNLDVSTGVVNIGNAHNSFTGSSGAYMTIEDAMDTFNLSEDDITMEVSNEGYTWTDGYLCTTILHNSDLNWNIIVQKDTQGLVDELLRQTYSRDGFLFVLILVFIIIFIVLLAKLNSVTRTQENTDELTGLINSKLFNETFERNKKKLFFNSGNRITSLFILDIDNFKHFNDAYGHLYGNTVIATMGVKLKEAVGKRGIVARWGGDEFVGALSLSADETRNLLDELLDEIKQLDTKSPLTFSCGIAKINNHMSLEENLKLADDALYQSKNMGKSRCTIFGN